MNSTQHNTTEDEIDLFSIIDYFLHNWKKIVLCSLLGLVMAIFVLFIITPKYEVTVSLDLAKVANGQEIHELESASLVLSRLQALSFRQKVSKELIKHNIIEAKEENSLIVALESASTFNTKTNLIDIKIQSPQPQEGSIILEAMLNQLIFVQQEKYNAYSNNQLSRIQQLEDNLTELETIHLTNNTNSTDINVNMYQFELSKISQGETFVNLKNQILAYKNAMKFPMSHTTQFFGEVNINPKPVFPKKAPTLLIGLLLGFIAGCGWALLLTVRKQYIERNNLLKESEKL